MKTAIVQEGSAQHFSDPSAHRRPSAEDTSRPMKFLEHI